MLKLNIFDNRYFDEQKLSAYMEENRQALATCQAGEERYHDSQDWLDLKVCAGEEALARIEKKAAEIREKADAFVLIGVGGSNNAARSVIKALQKEGETEIIYAGNTLAPHALARMLRSLEGKDIYIDCIAKNFETLEPGSSFRLLRDWMEKKYGEKASERIITTGTKGSLLEELSSEQGYDFFEFPVNVGGRYTAMTNVGLLPMAVAGIDVRALALGAQKMADLLHSGDVTSNLAFRYAAARNLLYAEGYRVEMLSSFEPRFGWFYKWWEQLFAESEGKDNKGIFPVTGEFSEELHSIGQFLQDGSPIIYETFLEVEAREDSLPVPNDGLKDAFDYLNGWDFYDINQAAMEATKKAHAQKMPCMSLVMEKLDAENFGALFYFFQFACYLSCTLMGVNAFDPPGVEAYKKWMFEALGKQ